MYKLSAGSTELQISRLYIGRQHPEAGTHLAEEVSRWLSGAGSPAGRMRSRPGSEGVPARVRILAGVWIPSKLLT